MAYARQLHKNQFRKYSGNPYFDHLAEVTGIAMSTGWTFPTVHPDDFMATCWLHDAIEDQGASVEELQRLFGETVTQGVIFLSDVGDEQAKHLPRALRKANAIERLKSAPGWVQTIKVADIISNISSIIQHDREFAAIYIPEKFALLSILNGAERSLLKVGLAMVNQAQDELQQSIKTCSQ